MPIHAKAFVRQLYATVPGLAATRFAFRDAADSLFPKREFEGLSHVPVVGGTIIDVGADRGQSITAIRRTLKDPAIWAFEPGPNCNLLKARFHGDDRVSIFDVALASEESTIRLYVPSYGHWRNCDGMAATSYKEAVEWIKDPKRMAGRFDPDRLRVEAINVQCVPLDKFAAKPSMIKLSAQDSEYDIALGAAETIKAHRPAIMVAFAYRQQKLNDLLAGWGYRPFTYVNQGFKEGVNRSGTFTWFLHRKGM